MKVKMEKPGKKWPIVSHFLKLSVFSNFFPNTKSQKVFVMIYYDLLL